MSHQNIKSKNDIGAILFSLLGFIILFNILVQNLIKNSIDLQNKLNFIVNSTSVKIKEVYVLIIVITSIVAIITLGIYFIINKILLSKLKVNNVNSSKLFLTILISSSFGPLIYLGLLHFGVFNSTNTFLTVLTSLSLPLAMVFLLKNDFENKKQLFLYTFSLIFLSILNILLKYIQL